MTKEKNKKASKFWLGALVGGVLGVLFAPRKGKETREKVKEDLDNLKEKVDEASEVGAKKYSELKEEAKPYVKSFKKGLEGKKEDTEEAEEDTEK